MRTVRAGLAGVLLMLLAALSGCVDVPTTGPVEKVEGQPPTCQSCVNVEVAPPAQGDGPRQIVEGYLSAMNNYQAAYSVARQYLSKTAAEKWSPDQGVTIYRAGLTVDGSTVTLGGEKGDVAVGTLNKDDRTYDVDDRRIKQTFQLVRSENGEWRIDNPTPGLLVSESAFRSFYQAVNLYFVSKGDVGSLVPEPIYLPSPRNSANLASALTKALLRGPSKWLAPAVSTAVPSNTTLKVDSVTISDGIAEVPLSDTVLALPDAARAQLAAQIVYTLKQISIVKGVLITVDGTRFRVPQSDPTTMVVGIDDIDEMMAPVPRGAGSQLYVASGRSVRMVTRTFDASESVPGPLSSARAPVQSMAVSINNTDVAVVTDNRTLLVSAPITESPKDQLADPLMGGVKGLLRPQFSRYGELWVIGELNGRQRMWMISGSTRVDVNASVFSDGRVTAFKISPDGTRMALIRRTAAGSELGVALISRATTVTVGGWRPLDTRQDHLDEVTQMVDVAWVNATDILLLGAETKDAAILPYEISDDALNITKEIAPVDWAAEEITVQLPTQTTVVRGGKGQTYRQENSQWVGFGDPVDAVAFPG